MIDYGKFAAAYALFHFTHGVADYWVQTHWMAQNKSKPKGWLIPLSAHVVSYTLLFIPALILVGVKPASWRLVVYLLAIGLPHAWMDRRVFLTWFCRVTKGWKQPALKPLDKDYVLVDEDKYGRGTVPGWPEIYGIEQAVKVHVTIHMDQKFHYLCLGLTALALSYGW